MSNVLQAKQLSKAFDQVPIIAGLDFELKAGERVAILGASGSGKSTLLQLLGGLDRPDAGEVLWQGQNIQPLSNKQLAQLRNRSVSFIFQFHHLLPDFTAIENVAMPLLLRGQSRETALAQAMPWLERVGLKTHANHRVNELSGGERQRIAFCRALVTQPNIVLADEPTGNLDKQSAQQLSDLMVQLSQAQDTAFVLATHDERLAQTMDRVLVLEDGQLHAL